MTMQSDQADSVAIELPPIVDDSWFLSREADSIERAARTADRRPSRHAMRRTRPFGRRSLASRIPAGLIMTAAVLSLIAAAAFG